MRNGRLALACCLLLPALQILPSCSLVSSQHTLDGFPPDTAQQVRRQFTELNDLEKLKTPTPAQQKIIQQLHTRLQQFETEVIRTARSLEQQDDWHSAQKILGDATRILPNSQALSSAEQQLAVRRQLREERVRMELEIHQGEQLLKDVEAYRRLQQLKGPGLLNWLELKNFNRKRHASAQALYEHAQRALERKDYALAQRGLEVAQGLYGDDLQPEKDQLEQIEQGLAYTRKMLRPANPRPARISPAKDDNIPITDLQDALKAGDLLSARQHLNELQQRSPQPPQLEPLQKQFQMQLDIRVENAVKRGNELYSQGEIEQALEIWREAALLTPDNVELQSSIVRAEKLLENLKALSAPFGAES